jgi:alkanesulfonate monooxygenase SsuD/methylene tetrahydromethanopterin reductase-like flavin-dependent oxidoreductase (luciferase family)
VKGKATMRAVRFGIAIPQLFSDGEFDPASFRKYFARVEELGFHSAWAQEQVLGTASQLSPLETMTYAAACTQRLRLGCVVFVSTLHNPVHLAKSIAPVLAGRTRRGAGRGDHPPDRLGART